MSQTRSRRCADTSSSPSQPPWHDVRAVMHRAKPLAFIHFYDAVSLKEIEVVLLPRRRAKAEMNEILLRTVRPQGASYQNYCLSFLTCRALSVISHRFYRLFSDCKRK